MEAMQPPVEDQLAQRKKVISILRFLVPIFIIPIFFIGVSLWIELFSFIFAILVVEAILIIIPRILFKELEKQSSQNDATSVALATPDKTANWIGWAIVIFFVLALIFAFGGHPILSDIAWELIPFSFGVYVLTSKFISKKFGQKFRIWEIICGIILILQPLIPILKQF